MSDVDDEVEDKNDGDSDDDESGGDDDDRGNYEGNDDDNKGGPYLDGSGYFGTAKERCIKAPGWTFIKRFKTYALFKIPLCHLQLGYPLEIVFLLLHSSLMLITMTMTMTMTQVLPPEDPRWWSTLRGKRWSMSSSCLVRSVLYC